MSNIVIRLPDRIIRGTTTLEDWIPCTECRTSPPIKTAEADAEHIQLDGVKAVFFVKEPAGTSHNELRYYDNLSPLPCLWIRATFRDGEIVEGIVRNELSFLTGSGFFLAPVDPDSNNSQILVFKDQLVDCQVLGLRKTFEELPAYFK